MLDSIIKNRHTTRLMKDAISDDDVDKILTSARLAPSKNRIYGYKIYALTNSDYGRALKKRLCENVTRYQEEKGTIYLLQTLAPLVLIFMTCPAPEHQMVKINETTGAEVHQYTYDSVLDRTDKFVMSKNAIRDAVISATYAQLTAESLGLGTAFVACGLEDLIYDELFVKVFKEEFGEDFRSKSIEPAVIVCIGPKHEKIIDLYKNKIDGHTEPYLNGFTDLTRGGREKSFVVNEKQEQLIKTI